MAYMFKKALVLASMIAAVVAAAPGKAEAGPITLIFTALSPSGTTTFTSASNLVTGTTFSVGDFNILISSGASNVPGTAALGAQNLNAIIGFNTGAPNVQEQLTIELSENGYLLPSTPSVDLTNSASAGWVGGSTNDKVTLTSYFGASNTLFDLSQSTSPVTCSDPSPTPPAACSAISSTTATNPGPAYSLTTIATLLLTNGTGFDSVNLTGTTTAIALPEPATMTLFGSGLLALAGMVRRRKNGIAAV
jgi:hypothetical protein